MITLALSILVSQNLLVDPLLVRQAAEIWSVVAKRDNAIWPGWDASKTPLLIYLPGEQDLLINHPKPPAGFVPYEGPVRFPGGKMMVKNGPTIISMDGQNTSMEINGIETLVVADRLSNMRQQVQGVVDQARGTSADMSSAITNSIRSDPYDSMLMFAHEAFHVYQRHHAPNKGGNELALTQYPSISVRNNVGFALESEALIEAMRAETPSAIRTAAVRWLAVRKDRRSALPRACTDYEDGTEFNEGLAKYVEYRALQVFQGRKPGADLWLIQGFRGYDDLVTERLRLQDRMREMMSGRVNINNDKYGASPVRMRLYFSGMGIAALLDLLGAKWHDAILDPGSTLTSLAEMALKPTSAELDQALQGAISSSRAKEITTEKEKLEGEGKAHVAEVLKGFDRASAKVVVDYKALKEPRVGFAFTPFGVLAVDENRTVFRLIPLRGVVGKLSFSEDSARPMLQDRARKEVTMTATGAIDATSLDATSPGWRSGVIAIENLKLPGLSLTGGKARLILEGKALRVVVSED